MKPIILDSSGNITDFQVLDSLFDGADDKAEERFQQSLLFDGFYLVIVLSRERQPIAYCSFYPYLTLDLDGLSHSLNVQIDYVYVDPKYRGQGITNIMVPVVVECCIEVAESSNNVNELTDISEYIGDGGRRFGCKIFQGIFDAG